MKKLTNFLFYSLYIVVLLAGCIGKATPAMIPATAMPSITATPPKAPTSTPTLTITPSVMPSPTRTETLTPAPTNTPTIPAEARLDLQCLEVAPKLPDGASSTGVLVLENRETVNNRYLPGTFLLDMTTGQTVQIAMPRENQVDHSVSPDRKLQAYISILFNEKDDVIQKDLIIATADGQRLKSISWKKDWGRLLGWLNNERIVITIYPLNAEEDTAPKPVTLLVLNPFSGARQTLEPNLPGIYDLLPFPPDYWWLRTYDPALTRVAYLKITDDYEWVLALWDLQKHKLLASLSPYRVSMPVWAPDGSRLVTNAPVEGYQNEELFLMSRDGQIEQLTNLGVYYEHVEFFYYSWSPDGRYIASWITTFETSQIWDKLVIVDTDTRQVTDYCKKFMFSPPISHFFWSPDGKQLVFYDGHYGRVILIDREQGFAAQIAVNQEPMGWMLAP